MHLGAVGDQGLLVAVVVVVVVTVVDTVSVLAGLVTVRADSVTVVVGSLTVTWVFWVVAPPCLVVAVEVTVFAPMPVALDRIRATANPAMNATTAATSQVQELPPPPPTACPQDGQ